eukprot:365738-Chlamydomonas_euryale.AAC.24
MCNLGPSRHGAAGTRLARLADDRTRANPTRRSRHTLGPPCRRPSARNPHAAQQAHAWPALPPTARAQPPRGAASARLHPPCRRPRAARGARWSRRAPCSALGAWSQSKLPWWCRWTGSA